jgi:hypothetical protein
MAARTRQFQESGGDAPRRSGGDPVLLLFSGRGATAAGGDFISRRSQIDYRIAIHESGHTVVGRLLGQPVAGSTINFTGGHHGCTWADDAALQPGAETVADICRQLTPLMPGIGDDRADIAVELERAGCHVIELLAGPLADEMFCAARLPGTEHDEAEARAIAALIVRSPHSIESYIAFALAETRALLSDHRGVVLAVAEGLIQHRTLIGEEIDRIIRRELHQ